MAGVDRPLIAKGHYEVPLKFCGGRHTGFGLIFFSQEGDDVRSNELFHWLANQTNVEMRQKTSFFCKNVKCRENNT